MYGRHSKQRTQQGGWKALLTGLVVAAGVAWHAGPADATVRVGNSEIQVVYEMQHTFQFHNDPTDNFEWVQWRNELRVEYEYQDLVEVDRGLFGKNIKIPGVRRADFSFMYRGRFDPVFMVRDKYDDMYPHYIKNQHKSFTFPENGFREMNLDVDFGDVMGHRLSMKLGKQQIVWGESDLFRSIDIVNPLRIDQSGFIGEAFEDFRTPIWAVKFLYDLGNIGSFISNAGLEVFYTPRWRPITQHLVLEGGWGGLRYEDENYIGDTGDYFPTVSNNQYGGALGAPNANILATPGVPWAPYKDWKRIRHPWSLFRVGGNGQRMAPDWGSSRNGPNEEGIVDTNFVWNIGGGGKHTHMIRGTKWENSMVGARFMGKAFESLDFTLNYVFKRTEAAAFFDMASAFGDNYDDGLGRLDSFGRRQGSLDQELAANGVFVYDPTKGPNENGVWADKAHQNEFQRILDRCVRDGKATYLVGVDMYGFSQDGNPNNDRNDSFCFQTGHYYPWTNVFGFTLTYNDFDYTGAVFRVEQSWSTNEPRNFGPAAQGAAGGTWGQWNTNLQAARDRYMNDPDNQGYIDRYIADAAEGINYTAHTASQQTAVDSNNGERRTLTREEAVAELVRTPYTDSEGNPCVESLGFCVDEKLVRRRIKSGSSIWRSMIGFDLIQSIGSLPGMSWARRLPGGIGDQATFYTFQALTTYQNNNRPSHVHATTNAPFARHHRWEQVYTFGTSGFYFRGKLEPLLAYGYSVNGEQSVILAQTYWHDWLIRNLDLFVGAAIYPGSTNRVDGSLLNYYTDRDTVWLRLQYYLL